MKSKEKQPGEIEIIKQQFEVIECLNRANTELKKAFEIEKNCKNQVYAFIFSKNHFESYKEYTKVNPVKE